MVEALNLAWGEGSSIWIASSDHWREGSLTWIASSDHWRGGAWVLVWVVCDFSGAFDRHYYHLP